MKGKQEMFKRQQVILYLLLLPEEAEQNFERDKLSIDSWPCKMLNTE